MAAVSFKDPPASAPVPAASACGLGLSSSDFHTGRPTFKYCRGKRKRSACWPFYAGQRWKLQNVKRADQRLRMRARCRLCAIDNGLKRGIDCSIRVAHRGVDCRRAVKQGLCALLKFRIKNSAAKEGSASDINRFDYILFAARGMFAARTLLLLLLCKHSNHKRTSRVCWLSATELPEITSSLVSWRLFGTRRCPAVFSRSPKYTMLCSSRPSRIVVYVYSRLSGRLKINEVRWSYGLAFIRWKMSGIVRHRIRKALEQS